MTKWWQILLYFVFGFLGLWEQTKTNPNKIIMFTCMGVFMFGLYQIMKKVPSKNEENDTE